MTAEVIRAVVPAYDAQATVGAVVAGVRAQGLEVLVVDDGSQDATARRARDAGAHVLQHPVNLGKGNALVSGFRWALSQGATAVLTLDADGQHDPSDIPAFLARRDLGDLLVGERILQTSRMPLTRLLGNRVSTFFVGLFGGRSARDSQCGYRLYSRRLLEHLPLVGGRFESETEWLLRAELLGATVLWVPVNTIYANGQRSNFRNIVDTLRVIRVVLAAPGYPRGTMAAPAPREPA